MKPIRSLVSSALLLSINYLSVTADYTVKVDAATTIQPNWDGWGTSLCWWANVFGEEASIADVLFTLNSTEIPIGNTGSLPGLGLNIVRYNIGGSGTNVIDDSGKEVAMRTSKNMPAFKLIESYWVDWFNKDRTSTSWNWQADAKQRAMLKFAIERGANQLEAFSNAPPWWMTYNRATAGGDNGKSDNLQYWNYEEFALYLATVLSEFKTEWGITFNYIEPFNEPSESWWEYPGKQEGCHFSWDAQKAILPILRKQLDAMDLKEVAIAAADENSPTETMHTLEAMAAIPDVINSFTKVNTHGYEGLDAYRGPDRNNLRESAEKLMKIMWDSELAEGDGSGLTMAESISLDINEMCVTGIAYWQVLDGVGWGLIKSNPGDTWIGEANPKYFVFAQYSRHIRFGMKILASDDLKTVVSFNSENNLLVLVTVNVGDAQTITYDLASFGKLGEVVKVWTTETSGLGALYQESTTSITGTTFTAKFPARTVMTFEIEAVMLVASS